MVAMSYSDVGVLGVAANVLVSAQTQPVIPVFSQPKWSLGWYMVGRV